MMKTASDFLNDVQARYNLRSDYAIAKFFGWHQTMITNYRRGGSFDDLKAAQVAAALELEPVYVIACMGVQRAKSPQGKELWEGIARKGATVIAIAFLLATAAALSPLPLVNQALADAAVYYVQHGTLLFTLIATAYVFLSRRR